MAIQIRRKEEEKKVLEPEVLSAGGNADAAEEEGGAQDGSSVKLPGMEDEFLKKSSSAMAWLMEHRRMVILVAVLLVGVAFLYIGIQRAKESAAESRSNVLSPAIVTYTLPTRAQADAIEAQRQAYIESQGIAAETKDILKFTETIPDDRTRYAVIEKHLSTNLPSLAGEAVETTGRLMQAGVSARLRAPADAAAVYAQAEKSASADVRLFAMLGEAEMRIGEKNYAQALAIYDNVMSANAGMSSYATLEKGRIYELMGDKDKAIAAYAQVMREFNQPLDQAQAVKRLRFLTPDWATYSAAPAAPAAAPAPAQQADL